MSLLPLFLAWATPFLAFAAGFISSLIFIQLISNQWPSEGLVIVVFLATLLGTLGGGFIGYVLCPYKEQPGGWAWNCLPCIFISFGQWLGATIIPLLTSYFLATTQQWVNNLWPSSEQIFLIFLLILLEVIVGWLNFLQLLDMGNEG